jgi:hypothetical protein
MNLGLREAGLADLCGATFRFRLQQIQHSFRPKLKQR